MGFVNAIHTTMCMKRPREDDTPSGDDTLRYGTYVGGSEVVQPVNAVEETTSGVVQTDSGVVQDTVQGGTQQEQVSSGQTCVRRQLLDGPFPVY